MKKVKIIYSYHGDELEENVNDFVATHKVIDIQFQLSGSSIKVYAAMITYEE